MIERRQLSFSILDEVLADVDQLLAGYQRASQWSLGQICNHIATAIRLTIEGQGRLDPVSLPPRRPPPRFRRTKPEPVIAAAMSRTGSDIWRWSASPTMVASIERR